MGRALIVSAGASSNEYIAARLAEMGYARPGDPAQRGRGPAQDAGRRL